MHVTMSPRSDGEILNEISKVVAGRSDLDLGDFDVNVVHGDVTLMGETPTEENIEVIASLVSLVPGVTGIENYLTVTKH